MKGEDKGSGLCSQKELCIVVLTLPRDANVCGKFIVILYADKRCQCVVHREFSITIEAFKRALVLYRGVQGSVRAA